MFVRTRFSEKFDSWCWTWLDVVFLLVWCDVVLSLQFDTLILSRLNAYAWFGGSGAHDILEVSWTSTLDLGKRSTRCSSSWLNAYTWFEKAEYVMFSKLESWKKVCIFKGADLRGKLESWKKSCIFKEASIFEDGRLQKLGSLLALERILSRSYSVKNFQPLQMRRIPLFIEFTGGLYGLEPGWSMDQTHRLNHMDLGYK